MILWRYAAGRYLKTFVLTVATFVAVLLVSRFKEIARFAALSSDFVQTGLFTVYQIPFILPMAIPLSAFLSSFLLLQQLSRTHEFTALRASGLSLKKIFTPLLFTALSLMLLNFSICADLAPFCRNESRRVLFNQTSANPLVLLQRQNLLTIKDAFLKMDNDKEEVRNFTLISYNESNERLNLVSAAKLELRGTDLHGEDVAIVSHLKGDGFDPLIIENQTTMSTSAPVLSSVLKKNRTKLDGSALNFRMLRTRLDLGGKNGKSATVEMARRISLSLAVLSLTWLGFVFGIEQGRNPSKKPLVMALGLTLLVLASYLLGKGLKYKPLSALLVYSIPHLLIWIACLYRSRKISRGTA